MTLARRMMYKTVWLAVSLLLIGIAVVWGLRSSQIAVRTARDEYVELRMILDVDEHIVAARGLLATEQRRQAAQVELSAANRRIGEFLAFQTGQPRYQAEHEQDEERLIESVRRDLLRVMDRDDTVGHATNGEGNRLVLAQLDHSLNTLKKLASELDETIARAHEGSSRTLFVTLAILGGLLAATIVTTTLINVSQYRSVIRQLQKMRDNTSEIASGRFAKRLDIEGDREFARLAEDFNQMASQLEEIYRDLERKVREKSSELARSERLASVGYLAAGLAHEINNPLNIISGYAELSLKHANKESIPLDTQNALRIIRDEAFRCKEIISKLLSLPSGGENAHGRVSLSHLADETAAMLRSLKQANRRIIQVDCPDDASLDVLGNETELKQVLLNLSINALNAVEPCSGKVQIRGARHNGLVELQVVDNGCGMGGNTLEKVFEPFFTTRRGSEGRGIGLGLSITYAIVSSHGGTITAESAGPGKGSTFTIRLPSAADEGGTRVESAGE